MRQRFGQRPGRRIGRLPAALLVVAAVLAAGWGIASPRAAHATSAALASFVATYGDPPAATFGRIRIPAIGVDAAVGAHEVAADGFMPAPFGPGDVAWYDFANLPGYGGEPGAGVNAIFSGHVDYVARVPYAGVRYGGTAVFWSLHDLEPGAVVEVERGGETLRYTVSWVRRIPAEDDAWADLLTAQVPLESITLFTCGGDFDARRLEYEDRIVVRAERVIGTPRALPQTWGDYTAGISGTNSPAALAAAQAFPVHAIWKLDEATGGYLFWGPDVPAFLDTLSGRLRPADFVILRIR